MSHELLRTLQRRHAFDPTPPEAQLGRLHVPFDHLTGSHDFEDKLAAACRRGERVALIGPSGGGKSSITEHVLFPPNLQDLAPIKVRVGLDPQVVTDPTQFVGHLLKIVAAHVARGSGRDRRRVGDITRTPPASRGAPFVGVGPSWLHGELRRDLATVLEQPSGIDALDKAQQILALIAHRNLIPVLVLDDTDHWLSVPAAPDPAPLRAGFFGPILRVIAEGLSGAAAVIAVHNTYLTEPAYQAASGFLETLITLPRLPGPNALAEILTSRARVAMSETALAATRFVTPAAVEVLFEHYQRGNPSVRTTIQIAHAALAYACDDGASTVDVAHVELAITE